MNINKVILVDSLWLLNRTAFKLTHLRGLQGVPTGAEYGFLKTLQALNREISEAKIILCWDGKNNFRKEIDPLYKANRKNKNINKFGMTLNRIESFKNICKLIYEIAEHEKYEADDIMASIACSNKYDKVYLFSNDKDLLQVVSEIPKIIRIPNWRNINDPQGVNYVETFYNGLKPYQLPIYFAFKGDKVDNVIGIPRINSTKLAGAIKESWNPDFYDIVEHQFLNYYQWKNEDINKLSEFIDSGKYSKNLSLINLKKDININIQYPPKFEDIKEQLRQWLIKMEFRTLKICKDVGLIHRTTSCDDAETQALNIIKNNPELKGEF